MSIALRNWVLLAILTLLAVAHWRLERAGEERPLVALFPGLSRAQARTIVLSSADGNQELRLEYKEGRWTLPAAQGYPARPEPVDVLLDRLSNLTDVDLVGEGSAEHEQFGVTENALLVRVLGEGGVSLAALVQGKEAPRGSGDRASATFVRPLGGAQTYRAARLEPLSLSSARWLDSQWRLPEPHQVQSFALRGPDLLAEAQEFVCERAWSGATLELLEYGRALFLEEVIDPKLQPSTAALEVDLVLENGERLLLSFGSADEGGARLAWRSDQPWLVRLSSAMVHPFLERARRICRKGQ